MSSIGTPLTREEMTMTVEELLVKLKGRVDEVQLALDFGQEKDAGLILALS